jgi:hypothetical protein
MVDPMMRCIKFATLLAGMIVLLVEAAPCTQQSPKRLILKDGSYQTVTRWEVAGNHVRYYSAERYAWEELPADLVDWLATEKYNRERDAERANTVLPLAKGDDEGDIEPPLAAPGLRLPDGGGVFLLDAYQKQPQLLELAQNGGELNRHTGRNILRAAVNPLTLSARQTIELKGERAKVQSHVTQPVIYVDVDTGEASNSQVSQTDKNGTPPPQQQQRFGIVRVEQKKGLRVVGNLNVAVYGKVTQKEKWIKTTSVPMGEWTKVAPDEPLPAGEYAVVELLEKGQINLYVWDFGVDPSAPANPNAWTPRHAAQGLEEKPPSLGKRPN